MSIKNFPIVQEVITGNFGEVLSVNGFIFLVDAVYGMMILDTTGASKAAKQALDEVLQSEVPDNLSVQDYLTEAIFVEMCSAREDDEFLKAQADRLRQSLPDLVGLVCLDEEEYDEPGVYKLFVKDIH